MTSKCIFRHQPLSTQVSEREKEMDALRADLQSLSATLENAAVHQREDIHREQV